ncbi:putative nucleotidyltransferase [Oxalobacteraceae bacterium GrIS 2.11]
MRISSDAANQALNIITQQFGGKVMVWLFGSRANDMKRGGDVDIYVESSSSDLMQKIKCQSQLMDLFDLNVDLIVGNGSKPIHRIAKETGVRLR